MARDAWSKYLLQHRHLDALGHGLESAWQEVIWDVSADVYKDGLEIPQITACQSLQTLPQLSCKLTAFSPVKIMLNVVPPKCISATFRYPEVP